MIAALHKLFFEEDGDRNNRRRLREFNGFKFNDDSLKFRAKVQYAVSFTIGDLISICNVLGIEYTGNAGQLKEKIVRILVDIHSLCPIESESDKNDEDGDEDDENVEGTP